MPEISAGVSVSLTLNGTDLIVSSSTVDINAQTGTTYTFILGDAGHMVTCTNASPITVTVPTNASVEFPTGTTIALAQLGVGVLTIEGDTGVTLNGVSGGGANVSAQYGTASLIKLGTDTWLISGSIGAVS